MRNGFKVVLCFLLLICCGVWTVSCGSSDEAFENENGYALYYLKSGVDTITPVFYRTDTQDTNSLVEEIFEQLREPIAEETASVIPKTVFLSGYEIENRILYMVFSENYSDMDTVSEVLFRAAVVKSMVQIEGIDYVTFYVNSQPLLNSSGVVIGTMNASSFVDDSEESMDSLTWVDLTLYYADESGEALCGEKTSLAYSKNIAIEHVIVEKLIEGPTTEQCRRSVPADLSVISASTKDGVCYVNLSSAFLNSLVDASAQVTIYSIVNSLCELSSVKKVQFLVNGSSDYTFREKFSLMETYERNLDLIVNRLEAVTEAQ